MNKFKYIQKELHSIRGKVLGKLVVLLAACMSLLWNEPLNGVVGSSRQFVILHSTFVPSFAESGRHLLQGNKLLIGFWLEARQFQSGYFSQALSIEF